MARFQVDLDFYHGPLDLLVVLVRQGEIDILELMIGEITRRYVDVCELKESFDIEEVGDFLSLATILMETKSRHLLPRVEESDQEVEADETKQELVKQLLEYRRFKEAAALLGERAIKQQRRLSRQATDLIQNTSDPSKQPIRELELWDLVSAFSRLMRENIVPVTDTVEKDPTPLPVYMNRLEAMIVAAGEDGISFRDLLGTTNARAQIIGKFLATLELIKGRRVWVEFDPSTEEIVFYPPRSEPLVYSETETMPMADTTPPPDAAYPVDAEPLSAEDLDHEAASDLIARLNADVHDAAVEANPESAWASFEPIDDDEWSDEEIMGAADNDNLDDGPDEERPDEPTVR